MKGYSDVVDSYGGDDHPHIESQIEGTVESIALTTCVLPEQNFHPGGDYDFYPHSDDHDHDDGG